MKIIFYIEDDIYLSSERCELTLEKGLFDKPNKNDPNLVGMCKYIACLRGHKYKTISIKILDIEG